MIENIGFRRNMICNKRARNNICFGDENITADFKVQGTVVTSL